MKLSECIDKLFPLWIKELKAEAESGEMDSYLKYCKIVKKGCRNMSPDPCLYIYLLQKVCFRSAEAAYKLGRAYQKGKILAKSKCHSYFYYRLSMLYGCTCNTNSPYFHNDSVSRVNDCFSHRSLQAISSLHLSSTFQMFLNEKFTAWVDHNIIPHN